MESVKIDKGESLLKKQIDKLQSSIKNLHRCLKVGVGESLEVFNATWFTKYLMYKFPSIKLEKRKFFY